jgi:hypothetical protein
LKGGAAEGRATEDNPTVQLHQLERDDEQANYRIRNNLLLELLV